MKPKVHHVLTHSPSKYSMQTNALLRQFPRYNNVLYNTILMHYTVETRVYFQHFFEEQLFFIACLTSLIYISFTFCDILLPTVYALNAHQLYNYELKYDIQLVL